MKKNKRVILLMIIVPFLTVIALLGFMTKQAFNVFFSEGDEEVYKNEFYSMRTNVTDYQRQLYDELTAALNEGGTEEEIATLVVKNYIADFYTWTNKDGGFDVGGLEYVYGGNVINFYQFARDKFYHNVSVYIDEYGSADLLEVVSVNAKGAYSSEQFVYEDKVFDAFYVEATWEYKANSKFDNSKYQRTGYFNVIMNEHGRYEIVNTYN